MITRALEQSGMFASELEGFGAQIVFCPMIEIVEPDSYEQMDEAIDNLYGYDWLVFTSVNGVDYFLRRMENQGHEREELDELRVCAIGDATAERLHEKYIHVDVVPEQSKAEGVFTALERFIGGRVGLNGQNFLIPCAAIARDYLPRALEEAGARVDVVAAYRTIRPHTLDRGRVEALLIGGAIDCITFTSSSTVTNLAQLFETTDLSTLLAGVTVAVIGDITAERAASYGLETKIMPGEYTTTALARAIRDFYVRAFPT